MTAARVIGAAILVVVLLWVLLILTIFLFSRRDEARPADAVVVLGAAQYDGRPSPVLRARLDHALQLYGDGIARRLIFTGGVG
ncbi:MAG: YdcF family protein, partial [Gemmatimonadetes bacterium]|nr:YdcF family protein [Gemmatimonadota bacterium]